MIPHSAAAVRFEDRELRNEAERIALAKQQVALEARKIEREKWRVDRERDRLLMNLGICSIESLGDSDSSD